MRFVGVVSLALCSFFGARSVAAMPAGPLRIDPLNRRYFSDGTQAVYLTGSHTWANNRDNSVSDPPLPFNYTAYLDFMAAHNHNFFRLWTWEQSHSASDNPDGLKRWYLPFPWLRTGPGLANDGKPRFDLTRFNQAYFDRLRSRINEAGTRDMYVAVMLFDGWSLVNSFNATDGGFPYGPGNNVNNIASGGPESQALAIPAVTAVQEALVRKIVDTVNDLDNVLYEIANETSVGAVAWQNHMIDFVHQYESGKPKKHPVGFTVPWPGNDSDLYSSHADWISPNTQFAGSNGSKVVMNDTDHSYSWPALKNDGPAAQRAWAWKVFTLGANPMFMDPYLDPWTGRNSPSGTSTDPYWEVIRYAMGDTRTYANKLDLEKAVPSGALSSTGYCLADPGWQYLVYQPGSGVFTLNVFAGTYKYEWFNPSTRVVALAATMIIPTSGTRTFTPPFPGDAVLLLSAPSAKAVPASSGGTLTMLALLLLAAGSAATRDSSRWREAVV